MGGIQPILPTQIVVKINYLLSTITLYQMMWNMTRFLCNIVLSGTKPTLLHMASNLMNT
jgi:hypothetical protein